MTLLKLEGTQWTELYPYRVKSQKQPIFKLKNLSNEAGRFISQ